jgi:hypothetical protein
MPIGFDTLSSLSLAELESESELESELESVSDSEVVLSVIDVLFVTLISSFLTVVLESSSSAAAGVWGAVYATNTSLSEITDDK